MLNIIWFTGLSGSGKTVLALLLLKSLKKKYHCLHIDGDKFRKKKRNKLILTKKNIINNNLSIIKFCKKNQNKFDYIVVSVISPLLITRKRAFKEFGSKYKEFFVKAKISDLIKRDTKGFYKRAIESNFEVIGYNSKIKYEISKHKKVVINTSKLNKKACIGKIKKVLF